MLLDKADLGATLRLLSTFDATASPYISVLLTTGSPEFYRSSSYGFMESKNFDRLAKLSHVSLASFLTCLRAVEEDKVTLATDVSGFLRIDAGDSLYPSEIRVHTVSLGQTGLKYHNVGKRLVTLDGGAFEGVNTRIFNQAQSPILVNGKMMLPTFAGAVVWQGPDSLRNVTFMPRTSFVNQISSQPLEDLFITDQGYWAAVANGFIYYVKMHDWGTNLFQVYNVQGREVSKLPAPKLVSALTSAAALAGKNNVTVAPKRGVITRDKYGNESVFSLGGVDGFDKFSLLTDTAKLIVDAFSQTQEEEAVLSIVPNTSPTMRLTRGAFSVNFKVA